MGRSPPLEGDLFSNVRTRLIGEPQVGSSRNIRDKPQAATALSPRDFVIRRDGFAFEHEFVKRLQPADTCDVAAPQRGPVALNDVARVSTIPIRGGYLIRQSTLEKTAGAGASLVRSRSAPCLDFGRDHESVRTDESRRVLSVPHVRRGGDPAGRYDGVAGDRSAAGARAALSGDATRTGVVDAAAAFVELLRTAMTLCGDYRRRYGSPSSRRAVCRPAKPPTASSARR